MPDPKRQYWSPYLAMGNNPINRVDPDGGFDCPDCPQTAQYAEYINSSQKFGYDSEIGVFNADMGITIFGFRDFKDLNYQKNPAPQDVTREMSKIHSYQMDDEMKAFQTWLEKKGGIAFFAQGGAGQSFAENKNRRTTNGIDISNYLNFKGIDLDLQLWADTFEKAFVIFKSEQNQNSVHQTGTYNVVKDIGFIYGINTVTGTVDTTFHVIKYTYSLEASNPIKIDTLSYTKGSNNWKPYYNVKK